MLSFNRPTPYECVTAMSDRLFKEDNAVEESECRKLADICNSVNPLAAYCDKLEESLRQFQARIIQIDTPFEDEGGTVWTTPTAYAYAQVCKALETYRRKYMRVIELGSNFFTGLKRIDAE